MQSIDEVTLNVRKAYRFLFQYQCRILDLMSFVSSSLGLVYQGGYPKFSNAAPNSGRGKLDHWAWDWLNMYFYEFHFCLDGEYLNDKCLADKVKFSAFIVNDTGYYDSVLVEDEDKRLYVEKFETVEKSKTKLIFVAAKNRWGAPKEWGEWQSQTFLNSDRLIVKDPEADSVIVSKIYALDAFATEPDAVETLREFGAYCTANGIPIQYREREV